MSNPKFVKYTVLFSCFSRKHRWVLFFHVSLVYYTKTAPEAEFDLQNDINALSIVHAYVRYVDRILRSFRVGHGVVVQPLRVPA